MMDRIERIKVASSNVESIGYDKERKELYVEYANGWIYSYAGVPGLVYEKLMESNSKGRFLANNVKSVFMHTKLTPEEEKVEETLEKKEDNPAGIFEQLLADIDNLKKRINVLEIEVEELKAENKKKQGIRKKGPGVFTGRVV
jgi:uncharacterized small protein (DUF1192 family)